MSEKKAGYVDLSDQSEKVNPFMVPAWCPQCGMPMKGKESTHTFYNYGVCSMCFIGFIEGSEQRWKDGWRPTAEQIKAYTNKF